MNDRFFDDPTGTITVDGFTIELCGTWRGFLEYFAPYDCVERKAAERLRAWAKYCHGNAPVGTPYASYRITLPNGKRRTIVYCV